MVSLGARAVNGTLASRKQCAGRRTGVSQRSRQRLVPAAIFGWGKKTEEDEWREEVREEQYQLQQETLAKRRTGAFLKDANVRRQKVSAELQSRKALRQAEKDALAEGVLPESLKKWQPYSKETNENANSGIVVPLLPFGIRKYDDGERFDLRSPYADDGWVDPEETDMWAGIKKLGSKVLNLSGKAPESQKGKPIIWASKYNQYVRDQQEKKGKGPNPK